MTNTTPQTPAPVAASPATASQQGQFASPEQIAADLRAILLRAAEGAGSSEKPSAGLPHGGGSQQKP